MREIGRDHRRCLAAQFQGHRAEVGRRGRHDGAPDAARAGEDHVVERQLRKLRSAPEVFEERDLFGGQVARKHFDEQARQVGGAIRHLHQRAVAGGHDVDQRTEREKDREVPGNHHAHHAQRLGDHAVARAGEDQVVDRSALRTHPFGELPEGVADALAHREELDQACLGCRSHAEVGVDGLDDRRLVLFEEAVQRREVSLALLKVRVRIGPVGSALQFEALGKGEGRRFHDLDFLVLGTCCDRV